MTTAREPPPRIQPTARPVISAGNRLAAVGITKDQNSACPSAVMTRTAINQSYPGEAAAATEVTHEDRHDGTDRGLPGQTSGEVSQRSGKRDIYGRVNGHKPARCLQGYVQVVRDGLQEAYREGLGRHVGEGGGAQGNQSCHGGEGVATV